MKGNQRPNLSRSLGVEEFSSWYWLKEELVEFCRTESLPTHGLKREVELRIRQSLSGDPISRVRTPKRTGKMPNQFRLDTVIDVGWRCGPALGRFFKDTLGPGFRFNAAMRNFIHKRSGSTLADAVRCYRESVYSDAGNAQIPEQLEYNQHFRDFFQAHPGASKAQAIEAWWVKRGMKRN